jgi:glycosyltransferase involved in cell wall biosynthesis
VVELKIALINIIRPQEGSGDGITEYAYRLYENMKKAHKVDLVYSLESSRRNDVVGNLMTHSAFKLKIRGLADAGYDIIHITNQELGFAAKILKDAKTSAKVVTSIHDLMRLLKKQKDDFHVGLMQGALNRLVSSSINDAVKYSDMVIFTASTVEKESKVLFDGLGEYRTTLLGPKEIFRRTRIPKPKAKKSFDIGFVGALAFRKNPIFILKTAKLMLSDPKYKFVVWGNGFEKKMLEEFKEKNNLTNVSFMGYAPEKGLIGVFDAFDLFFYPSLEEGSSLPILEAAARGLPVVVYDKNKIDVEVTKYCFVSKSPEDAARLIRRLATGGYTAALKKRSTEYARSFSWARVTKETIDAYKAVL